MPTTATALVSGQVADAVQRIRSAIDFQDSRLVERRTALELLAVALVSRTHIILHGNPGNAKSMSVDGLLRHMPDLRMSKTQAYKASPPEQFLGQISLSAMEQDRYERIVAGKFADCDVYYCDEVPRAPRALLPAFQGGMVEREFDNGSGPQPIDLMTFIGTSNHIPDDEELEAFFDRFTWKFIVEAPQSQQSLVQVLQGGAARRRAGAAATTIPPEAIVSRDDILALQHAATQVEVPDDVYQAVAEVYSNLTGAGVDCSPRRLDAFVSGLQAIALLDGRDAVNVDDIVWGEWSLWSSEVDLPAVREEVVKHASDWTKEMRALLDAFNDSRAKLVEMQTKLAQGAAKSDLYSSGLDLVNEHADNLRPLVEKHIAAAQGRDVSRLETVLAEIDNTREWVNANLLGGLL